MVLPCTNPTKSFWIEGANSPLRNHRTTEKLPEKSDVLVIGSGYSGATVAYWLSRYTSTPPSITILEARGICESATGRNGGLLKPNWYISYSKWVKLYGRDIALSLTRHERAHLEAFEELLREESIDCSFHMSRAWDTLMSKVETDRAFGAYDEMIAAEGPGIVDQLYAIRDPIEAEKATRIKGAQGAINSPSGQIWAYKFVHGLLTKLLERGQLNLQAHTPATAISAEADADGYWTITTPRGITKARRVVHAGNRWAPHLLPQLEDFIEPVRGTLVAVKADPYHIKHHFNESYGVRWDGIINNYFHQLPAPLSTIIVGGAKELITKDPSLQFGNDNEDEVMPGVNAYMRAWPSRDMKDWDGSAVADLEIAGEWTGVQAYSVDDMPFVGPVPGKEGQFVQASFCGHGMPRILLTSSHTATEVLSSLSLPISKPEYAKAFPELPRPFRMTTSRLELLRSANSAQKYSAALAAVKEAPKDVKLGMESVAMKKLDSTWESESMPLVNSLGA